MNPSEEEYLKARKRLGKEYGLFISSQEFQDAMKKLESFMRPECVFDDSLTDWDRDFLRTNRIQP